MFIRKKVLNGKIPDAHIVSTAGIICVDSKFPLDNYRKMVETDEVDDAKRWKKQFEPIYSDWVADMKSKGIPGDEILKAIRQAQGK